LRLFYHVTVPMISPVILFNVVVSLIGSFQTFAVPFIMTNGGVPIVWMVSTSLKVDAQIFTNPPTWIPNPIRWHNYVDALSNFDFWLNLKNTLTITVPAVTGTLLSSSIVAYSLARINWPGRDILFALILATMMIPAWVTLIPLYILFNKIGWVGTFLPLQVPSWTGDAFSIFLLRQFFRQQPQEMFDAAAIDGAGHIGLFWRILLPLSKPALGVGCRVVLVHVHLDGLPGAADLPVGPQHVHADARPVHLLRGAQHVLGAADGRQHHDPGAAGHPVLFHPAPVHRRGDLYRPAWLSLEDSAPSLKPGLCRRTA
jgi:ABC-type glycerol-3-phosphate transport system permease component